MLIGLWTGVFMVSTITGPLIGGAFTSEWGGQSRPWSDGSVIVTFVVTEWFEGEYAMVPLSLLKLRMAWSNAVYGFITNLTNFNTQFYLPIYFQSIYGQSAFTSGVNAVSYIAFFALGSMISGILIGKTRFLRSRYIGPQVIFGIGIGLGSQIPMTALQSFSAPENVASITGIMLMFQSIASAYFLTAAQSIFANRLLRILARDAPHLDAGRVLATGASDIQRVFTGDDLQSVLEAYMVGIKDVLAFISACSAFLVLLSLVIPSKKPPRHDSKPGEKDETAALP
ncbi:hypothetical protein DL766_003847 [Monosporascus sp. MC13-8B]|uniref:Major facilitator superfamily (MFS) profile domain-containing protein n=1 Tax=Monosporascus cannonballus TaxID=155416 RepID=A0ABY0HK91_9PEZI|nr:hypothetical protein DL762_000240 [Monosporascus cannonballus]RYO99368.1 hypothetical protein DL763_001542 [Monosporascus cannonballus]RYP32703.1 hypothetical protein DL766_003847 [Monosporascus sp. MC13-8B]